MDRKFRFIIDVILIGGLIISAICNVYVYSQLGSVRYATVIGVEDNVELQMTIKNPIIKLGENIDITLTLRNIGNKNITLRFYSGQAFDVFLYSRKNNLVSKWSAGQVSAAVVWNKTLEPNETYTRILQWNLYRYRIYKGAMGSYDIYKPPIPGNYYLVGACVAENYVHLGVTKMVTSKLPITIVSWYYPSIFFVIILLISCWKYFGHKKFKEWIT